MYKQTQKSLGLIIIFICVFILSIPYTVYAVPAAPSQKCRIIANITDLQKGVPTTNFVTLNLQIENSEALDQEGIVKCDNWSGSGKDALLNINDFNNLQIVKGQKIEADVKFAGDERLHGNFLSNVVVIYKQIVDKPLPPNKANEIPLPMSQKCKIEAEVLSVIKGDSADSPVDVKLKIKSSEVIRENGLVRCESLPITQPVTLLSVENSNNLELYTGDYIRANTEFLFLNQYGEFFLSNIKVVSKPTPSTTTKIPDVVPTITATGTKPTILITVPKTATGTISIKPIQTINKYKKDLYLGLKNIDVINLQADLSKDKTISATKLKSGRFDTATQKAVKKFQKKYGIKQTGYVGPATRLMLNKVFKK